MISKILKAVWFVSVLVYMVVLMYVYAGLPEEVEVLQGGNMYMLVGREAFFYMFLGLSALTNFLVYSYYRIRKYSGEEGLLIWIFGLGLSLNFFYMTSMNFINLYNSPERIDFSFSGYLLFAALGILCTWVVLWPIYNLVRKFLLKV